MLTGMSAPRVASTSQRLVVLLAAAAGAVFVYLAARHLDFAAILTTWRSARPLPWVPLAVACYLTGHVVRGARCRQLLRRDAALSLGTASNIVVVGYASNNVLPARLGELVRCGMLSERTGIPIAQALTITFVERLLDGIAILVLLVIAGAQRTLPGWLGHVRSGGALVFGGAALAVVAAMLLPGALVSLASRSSARLGHKWQERAIRIATSIANGVACIRQPRDAIIIAALSAVIWLLESGMFACILPAFGLPLELGWAVIAMSVTNLGLLLPSTPGYVGPFHFFCSQTLVMFGVSTTTAVSYAILVHLTFFLPVTLWGVAAVLWYGVEVGSTAATARAARRSPGASDLGGVRVHVIARVDAPRVGEHVKELPELYLALAEALVPKCEEATPGTTRDVALFLHAQISSLPRRLRTMFELGMTAFRVFVRVRYFRSFCGLPLERRRDAVNAWAFGRVHLFRQLFRPVRSIALLAFYELTETRPARTSDGPAPGEKQVRSLPIASSYG